MILEATTLLSGIEFPEGPRWRDGKLWFSDMGKNSVMTVDINGNVQHIVDVPGQPSGLGWLPDGHLLVVSMRDQRLLRLNSGRLEMVADLRELASYVLNDMVVDTLGRAYIGNFGFAFGNPSATPGLAEIIMVMPEGDAYIVADKMAFPNGSVITQDGRTFIVAETLASRLTAFDIEQDGSLAGRRIWAEFDSMGFKAKLDSERISPDGICLDAKGAVWVATPTGPGEVLRVLEGGQITHRVKVYAQPLAVMLGGPDRQTLFICTSRMGGRGPGKGRIETVRVDVPGAGLP